MKKALLLVVVCCCLLFSTISSSFACAQCLCTELEKRGLSPKVLAGAIARHFNGSRLAVKDSGKTFFSSDSQLFNLAVGKSGKIYPVKSVKNPRGMVFAGLIDNHPVKIFLVDQGYVGIKTEENYSALSTPTPTSYRPPEEIPAIPARPVTSLAIRPDSETKESRQIIETTMADAPALMSPIDEQVRLAQERASLTNQQVKQVEVKKKVRNQRYADAGVTTAAIVTGLAIAPPVGPLIAGGIILGRVGWGLFQSDPNDE